jgi:hypothetical protein
MSQREPAKKTNRRHRSGDRNILQGDIIVTAVAGQYAIGQMTADGDTQVSLGSQPKLAEALERACALAGPRHRVFLYPNAGTPDCLPFDCPKVSTSLHARPLRLAVTE